MSENPDIEGIQRDHYDTIADQYAAHYGDASSIAYRRRFFYEPLFEKIELAGTRVIDAMCGNAETAEYLLEKGAEVTCIDISSAVIENVKKRLPGCTARCASVFETGLEDNSYDCVVVLGALHHLQPSCENAITEFLRILKPGGYLCFMEPHLRSLPDRVRQFWYKHDKLFAENEAAVDVDALKQAFSSKFEFIKEDYGGNVAYLLVYNSMIFRMPLWLKPIYSPILMFMESIIRFFQGRFLSCCVVCQWRKL